MSSESTEPGEDELRAAWEEQLRRLTPADVIVQTVVSLINLAGRRLGLAGPDAGERDLEQARDGIDGARALLPVLERREAPQTLAPLREALSALQLEYAPRRRELAARRLRRRRRPHAEGDPAQPARRSGPRPGPGRRSAAGAYGCPAPESAAPPRQRCRRVAAPRHAPSERFAPQVTIDCAAASLPGGHRCRPASCCSVSRPSARADVMVRSFLD